MLHPDSRYIPEIHKCLVDDVQARLLVALPGEAEALAQGTGRPREAVQSDLQGLFFKGLAIKKVKTGRVTWRASDSIPR